MTPDTIRTVIGIIGNGTALMLYLSPVPTFYSIWKKKTVEQYSAVPYLATLLNCMIWLFYGLPVVQPHSMLIITINGIGLVIELTYIAIFLAYSVGAARRRVLLILVAEVSFVAAFAALVLNLAHTHVLRSMVVGILCVIVGTRIQVCSEKKSSITRCPEDMNWEAEIEDDPDKKMVIQSKSVEYMPLFLSLASLASGTCWTAYVLIEFDLYITIPSALGVMFAVGQVILYAIYYKSTQRILEVRKQQILEARKVKADLIPMAEVVVDGKNGNTTGSGAGKGHC